MTSKNAYTQSGVTLKQVEVVERIKNMLPVQSVRSVMGALDSVFDLSKTGDLRYRWCHLTLALAVVRQTRCYRSKAVFAIVNNYHHRC